ncbi:MAG: DUF4350 domain-containing protein [Nitrososphaeria archaeon]|nr:DUF4350 domain-containing protein [Nitrososphaeria archaeon]
MRPSYTKIVALTAIASTLTILALSTIIPSSDDLMPDNPYWNGYSMFTKMVKARFTDPKTIFIEPEKTTLFIISPEKNITEDYIEFLKTFLDSGGTLVLMDETGRINQLLEELNVNVRIEGYPIMDPIHYYRSWKLPKIININSATITKNVTNIATDIPSAIKLENMQGIKVLAYTSYFSYMDLDGNEQPSKDDQAGPFPIAVEASYGKGKILVFSDSSLFINSIIDLGDNKMLLKNIIGENDVIVDSSQWNPSAHAKLKTLTLQAYNIVSVSEIKYSIVACMTIITYITVRSEKGEEEKINEIEEVLRRHPEWSPQLLKTLKEARENVIQ